MTVVCSRWGPLAPLADWSVIVSIVADTVSTPDPLDLLEDALTAIEVGLRAAREALAQLRAMRHDSPPNHEPDS